MSRKTLLITSVICAICVICGLSVTAGCSGNLRFAPTEAQKQVAMRTHLNALAVDADGADPGTPATRQLVEGTATSLSYIGSPAQIAQTPEQYAAVITAANTDAVKRPTGEDVFNAVDGWLALGLSVASIFTGAGAVKTVSVIKTAQEKSRALREVIVGNELLKDYLKNSGSFGTLDIFKSAQNSAQSNGTKRLVAIQKIAGDGALPSIPSIPVTPQPTATV